MDMEIVGAKFELGDVYVSADIKNGLSLCIIESLLQRHATCDWGELSDEDKKANDDAFINKNGRILSIYEVNDSKVYITTSCDENESTTMILYSNEY